MHIRPSAILSFGATHPTIKEAVGRCLRYAALTRAKQLIARWIRIVSTLGPAVIVRCCHSRTDGSGTQPHPHAPAHICSPIDAAAIDASAYGDASAIYAAIGQGIGRNTRDAYGGG